MDWIECWKNDNCQKSEQRLIEPYESIELNFKGNRRRMKWLCKSEFRKREDRNLDQQMAIERWWRNNFRAWKIVGGVWCIAPVYRF